MWPTKASGRFRDGSLSPVWKRRELLNSVQTGHLWKNRLALGLIKSVFLCLPEATSIWGWREKLCVMN